MFIIVSVGLSLKTRVLNLLIPTHLILRAKAIPFATDIPILIPVKFPGPTPTAMQSKSCKSRFAFLRLFSISSIIFSDGFSSFIILISDKTPLELIIAKELFECEVSIAKTVLGLDIFIRIMQL